MSDFYDDMIQQEENSEEIDSKVDVWGLISAITNEKNLSSIKYSKSDAFFIVRFFAHDARLLEYANEASQLYGFLEPEKILQYLEKRIPKGYYRVAYTKNTVESDDANIISEFFKVSKKRATEYLQLVASAGEAVYIDFMQDFRIGGAEGKITKNTKKRRNK